MSGASIVIPAKQTTTHGRMKLQPERHTINQAGLSASALPINTNKCNPTLSNLTYCAFDINAIRKYAIDSLRFIHHPHKDLLKLVDAIIRTRNNTGYKRHIGEVKSHTGVTRYDQADPAARNVIERYKELDIIFTDADLPIGGLRT